MPDSGALLATLIGKGLGKGLGKEMAAPERLAGAALLVPD
ncbi:hypothetical protein MPOCJGCO_1153 [Methylobacterium trifolii]|uniref:Uncharacterized protein n=1 Tax=Methylobacterium trifolii TaxID=1003092 RepID=A0ABQ4TVH1_9HYPH|nr:hypothetical protein MPOCJGCO_1153 [Methylobacterium trifolii]